MVGGEGQVEGGERGEDILVHRRGAEGWMPFSLGSVWPSVVLEEGKLSFS